MIPLLYSIAICGLHCLFYSTDGNDIPDSYKGKAFDSILVSKYVDVTHAPSRNAMTQTVTVRKTDMINQNCFEAGNIFFVY